MAEKFTTEMGGTAAIAELNNRFECWAGPTEPYPTYPCQLWFDTATNLIKQRLVTNDAWIIRAPISSSWGMSVGMVFPSSIRLDGVPGFIAATGALLNRAEWPVYWQYVEAGGNIVTDEVWHDEKRYYSYSYGDEETTFRAPMIYDFVRGLAAGGTIGQWHEDMFQGHYHKIVEPISTNEAGGSGKDYWDETNESVYLRDHGFTTRQAVTDGSNGEPRTGPETAPKNGTLPYYIYTGEVW
jgi:hypothetical protein